MKTDELTGPPLALWVARSLGWKIEREDDENPESDLIGWGHAGGPHSFGPCGFRPDLNWKDGGPLLDRLMASGEWCIQPWDDSFRIAPGCTVIISNYTLGGEYYDAHDVPVKSGNKAPRMDFITPTLLQAVCQATVASIYGPNVPNGAP